MSKHGKEGKRSKKYASLCGMDRKVQKNTCSENAGRGGREDSTQLGRPQARTRTAAKQPASQPASELASRPRSWPGSQPAGEPRETRPPPAGSSEALIK